MNIIKKQYESTNQIAIFDVQDVLNLKLVWLFTKVFTKIIILCLKNSMQKMIQENCYFTEKIYFLMSIF